MVFAKKSVSRRLLTGFIAMLMLLGTFSTISFAAGLKLVRTEAENFTGRDGGNGVTIEQDTENKISYVSSLDDTDAIVYGEIDFGTGVSNMSLRVKAPEATTLEVRLDKKTGPLVATAEIPSSADWTTVTCEFDEVRDEHDLYLMPKGEMELDWFECQLTETLPKSMMYEATEYLSYSGNGISINPDGETNKYVGHLGAEDTIMYSDVDFMTGSSKMNVRVSGNQGSTMTFILDSQTGVQIATLYPMPGGLTVQTVDILRTVGKHNVYLACTGEVQLDYFEILRDTDTEKDSDDDLEKQQQAQSAVQERMGFLGIMVGDEGGFRPNDEIKRSEFCKIVACMIGMDAAAKSTTPVQVFDDVDVSHWAANYIKFMYDMGVVSGMGDGTFNPDGSVTYEQALKMILCVLNFDVDAEEKGGYPFGYVVVADEIGVTKGEIEGATNVPATRGVIAQIVDNALEADMLVKRTVSGKETYVKANYNTPYEANLLSENLKVEKYEAVVNDIGKNVTGFKVGDKLYSTGKDANKSASYQLLPSVKDSLSKGAECEIYVKDGTVFKVDIDQYETTYDYIYAVNGDKSIGAIYDPENVSTMTLLYANETYSVAPDAKIYFDGAVTDAAPLAGSFAKISMDGDTIEKAEIYGLTEGGIVTEVLENGLTYLNGDMYGADLQSFGNATDVLVVIDRKVSSLDKLEPNMTVDFYKSAKTLIIVASSDMQYGTVTAYTDDTITVNGYEYKYDNSYENGFYYSFSEDRNFEPIANFTGNFNSSLLKQTVTLYAAPNGRIRYLWARDSSGVFVGAISKTYWENGTAYVVLYNLSDRALPKETYEVEVKEGKSDVDFEDIDALDKSKITEDLIMIFGVNSKGVIETIDYPAWLATGELNLPYAQFPRSGEATMTFKDGTAIDANSATFITLDNGLNKLSPKTLVYGENLGENRLSGVVAAAAASEDLGSTDRSAKYVFLLDGVESIAWRDQRIGVITESTLNTEEVMTINYYKYDGIEASVQMYTDYLTNVPERGVITYYEKALFGAVSGKGTPIYVEDALDLSDDYSQWEDGQVSPGGKYTLKTNKVVTDVSNSGKNITFADDTTQYTLSSYAQIFEVKDSAGEPMVKRKITNLGRNSVVSIVEENGTIYAIFYSLED